MFQNFGLLVDEFIRTTQKEFGQHNFKHVVYVPLAKIFIECFGKNIGVGFL